MKHTYSVSGMTCEGCKSAVLDALLSIEGVNHVAVNLEANEASITMEKHIHVDELQKALPSKYTIQEKKETNIFGSISGDKTETDKSKLEQLKPLLLIFGYLLTAAVLMNYSPWDTKTFMLDFMGLFFIVFSFFKMLDLKGFPESFRMYDPLAKVVPLYGWIYPFIESALGLMFLMRFEVEIALVVTLVILGLTTIGVTQSLFSKKSIKCACLGTALNLPMTEATFIENIVMLAMAVFMLLNGSAI